MNVELDYQGLEPWKMGFDGGKWVTFIIFTFIFLVIVCELEILRSNFCVHIHDQYMYILVEHVFYTPCNTKWTINFKHEFSVFWLHDGQSG